MQIERVNFADILVASALGAGLILTILFEQQELSMSIASGLFAIWAASRSRREDRRREGRGES